MTNTINSSFLGTYNFFKQENGSLRCSGYSHYFTFYSDNNLKEHAICAILRRF